MRWQDLSNAELVRRMTQRGYPEPLARRCVEARDRDDRSGRAARVKIASVIAPTHQETAHARPA